ncbi:MAG: Hsp20 family protein [Ahrensia sp.]|nr:Hsp20 family protein [Ahrensia sp.]
MRHVDFSPLYRSTVGFDRLFSLLDSMGQPEQSAPSYPPYNIERTGENAYRISMAVAGFGEADLDIESKENTLLVKGNQAKDEKSDADMLFRGIASRNFERRFQLADHVEVRSAHLENGLLHIDLVREIPEAMKARKISIGGGSTAKQIEATAEDGGKTKGSKKS